MAVLLFTTRIADDPVSQHYESKADKSYSLSNLKVSSVITPVHTGGRECSPGALDAYLYLESERQKLLFSSASEFSFAATSKKQKCTLSLQYCS